MRILVVTLLAVLACIAPADDGILYFNGSARLMHGESTIRMVQEYVKVKVSAKKARVYCRFVFHNDGPAVLARIGFPDGDTNWPDTVRDPDHATAEELVRMEDFRSAVDGKPVQTTLQKTTEAEMPVFHVKTVRFGRHQTRVVEDWYSQPTGSGETNAQTKKWSLFLTNFAYILSSGGSWKGNIGKATVEFEFQERSFRHLRPSSDVHFGGNPEQSNRVTSIRRGDVVWSGVCTTSCNR